MGIVLNREHWPIVIVEITDPPRLADWQRGLQELIAILAGNERVAVIVDARGLTQMPDAAMRKEAASLNDFARENPGHLSGLVNVVPSPFVRTAIAAVVWLSAPTFPQRTVSTLEEAMKIAHDMLA